MKLYLDDNRASADLVAALRNAGHSVMVPMEEGLSGATDPRHLQLAIEKGFILLTADQEDFTDLHDLIKSAKGGHPGITLILYENDSKRDMKTRHIVKAIGKLQKSLLPLESQLIVLNQWR